MTLSVSIESLGTKSIQNTTFSPQEYLVFYFLFLNSNLKYVLDTFNTYLDELLLQAGERRKGKKKGIFFNK